MYVKADREIVHDEGGEICFWYFFSSHHLPPCLIYTHTHPDLWSGEQNRDGRWSRRLSELLAAHLLQSRQKDISHKGPNSPDLYLAITHFLPCQHAQLPLWPSCFYPIEFSVHVLGATESWGNIQGPICRQLLYISALSSPSHLTAWGWAVDASAEFNCR